MAEENPQYWYAYDRIAAALADLRNRGSHVCTTAWNGQTGALDARADWAFDRRKPALILCDGIYLLHEPVISALDASLRVCADDDVIARRGMARARGDEARAATMQDLAARYSTPYFARYDGDADWMYGAGLDGGSARPCMMSGKTNQ